MTIYPAGWLVFAIFLPLIVILWKAPRIGTALVRMSEEVSLGEARAFLHDELPGGKGGVNGNI